MPPDKSVAGSTELAPLEILLNEDVVESNRGGCNDEPGLVEHDVKRACIFFSPEHVYGWTREDDCHK